MKLTKEEIIEKHKDEPEFINRFSQIMALSLFFSKCILFDDYVINPKFDKAIVLNQEGNKLYEKLVKQKRHKDNYLAVKLMVFIEFYHYELFIDINKTDINLLETILNEDVLKGTIHFPWIYGRKLYDKYFYDFLEQKGKLSMEETMQLLKDTPKGVFQIGKYIVGPFGLLITNNQRHIIPKRDFKLYHCADLSCAAFHKVELKTTELFKPVQDDLNSLMPRDEPSDWSRIFWDSIQDDDEFFDFEQLSSIHLTIVNTFGETELRALLFKIIEELSGFREKLPNTKQFKGSAKSITDKLKKSELFQLILLAEDKLIVKYLEQLISTDVVHIPATEIRGIEFIRPVRFYGITHQCNKLGFRSNSRSSLAINRLNQFILTINEEPTSRQMLEWNLRFYDYETLKEKVEAYTKVNDPALVIRETVLNGALQVQKAFDNLYGFFELPKSDIDERNLINKILWKLGFEINIYPDNISDFWNKFSNFKTIVEQSKNLKEIDKDEIRSAAVNLFVALEDILERSLSFATWLLMSDHYRKTAFKYDYEDARLFMCDLLEGQQVGTNEPLQFDSSGKNTLFPLTEGFTALANLCNNHITNSEEIYLRNQKELPSFYKKAKYNTFPFIHKALLFDIKRSDYIVLSKILLSVSSTFSKGSVLSVRNRLQHKRDDFPNISEILESCKAIKEVISQLEDNSLYPKVYLFKNQNSDKYMRKTYEFEDYRGRFITLYPTSEFNGSKLVENKKPQIILPNIHIENSLEMLRFEYHEPSEYLKYWKGFPLKKGKFRRKNIIENS